LFWARAIARANPFSFSAILRGSRRVRGKFRGLLHTATQHKKIMKLDSLETLFIEELRDLYSAESQLVKALPKMTKRANSEALKQAFEEHLELTKEHVERLDEIFENLGKPAKGKTCKGMKGLIEEGSEVLEEHGEASVIDAALIAAAQKVEHYEIATYGTVRTWAEMLDQDDAVDLLQQTLDEESETDEKLTEIAESTINATAANE
jgi:ferritin-like metal-binding protein YciE